MGRKSNAPQRQSQITWALYECLAQKGHEKVTIKSIAAQAGLPPGVIHYYFSSKDEIVSTLAQAIVTKYSGLLEERLAKEGSHEQRLESTIDFIVDELVFNPRLNRVFYNLIQMAIERQALSGVMKKMFQEYRDKIAEFLAEVDIGQDRRNLGAAVVALAEGFSLQLMVEPDAVKPTDVRKLFKEMLMHHKT